MDEGTAPGQALDPLRASGWRLKLRWTTAVVQGATAALVWSLPELHLPLEHVAPILVVTVAANVAVAAWQSRGCALPRPAAGVALLLEVVLLTGLLEITG